MDVIAVFDIGKTNKKFLLFDLNLILIHQEEKVFGEIRDDDGFESDDIEGIVLWMKSRLAETVRSEDYQVIALNFSSYGASLMHLDHQGERVTPLYNYLKPMPEGLTDEFYEAWGGVEEFSRITASPALGMLNSGLQLLWLKKMKPALFAPVRTTLHLPQYLSRIFTGREASEYTSVGCHTAMWDFEKMQYHAWLKAEKIKLPDPVVPSGVADVNIEGRTVRTGIGLHDSSASLVPYLKSSDRPFILVSTGTWCIFMNPFNTEPLTAEIKSQKIEKLLASGNGRVFFRQGIPPGYVDEQADLSHYLTYADAYHQMICDLVDLCMESWRLIIPADDKTEIVYVTGGFARNDTFVRFLAARLPDKRVYASQVENSTALGAAMTIYESAVGKSLPPVYLGLKAIIDND